MQFVNDEIGDSFLSDKDYSGPLEWLWDEKSIDSHSQLSCGRRVVQFHCHSSSGTSSVTGDRPFVRGFKYYWELEFLNPLYGTDTMVGIGTKQAKKSCEQFISLLGIDEESWGISYRGNVHHNGKPVPFGDNTIHQHGVIGLLLDTWNGTLEIFSNHQPLGVAFSNVKCEELYPMVCSTSAKTRVALRYSAHVANSLCMLLLSHLSENEEEMKRMNSIPGLRRLLQNNWWLLKRNRIDQVL